MVDLSEIYKNKLKKKTLSQGFTTGGGIAGGGFKTGNETQRLTGGQGNFGSGNGSATQSGSGIKTPTQAEQLSEQSLGLSDTTKEATQGAIKIADGLTRASDEVRQQNLEMGGVSISRLPSPGEAAILGGGSLVRADTGNSLEYNRSNTPKGKGGTFNTYTTPDYESAFSAVKDLNDYKANFGKMKEDAPVTVIGGYKSYAADLADYNSGNVMSEGYNRIRNERMNLQRQIDSATKGVHGSKAKAAIIESVLGNYSAERRALMESEASVEGANINAGAEQEKARTSALGDAYDRQQRANEFAISSGLQQADLLRKSETDRASQELSQQKLGFDIAKEQDAQALEQEKLGLQERDMYRKTYESGVSAQATAARDKIKSFEAELKLYKDSAGQVPNEVRDMLAKKYGFAE